MHTHHMDGYVNSRIDLQETSARALVEMCERWLVSEDAILWISPVAGGTWRRNGSPTCPTTQPPQPPSLPTSPGGSHRPRPGPGFDPRPLTPDR
jgi:hypothetical protein